MGVGVVRWAHLLATLPHGYWVSDGMGWGYIWFGFRFFLLLLRFCSGMLWVEVPSLRFCQLKEAFGGRISRLWYDGAAGFWTVYYLVLGLGLSINRF